MGDNFDKRLESLIADNTSGSRAIAAQAAGLFNEAVSGGWFSSADLAGRLRQACVLLRKAHPSLVAVQKFCDAVESALAGEGIPVEERLAGILEQWQSDRFNAAVAAMAEHLVPLIKQGSRILSHSHSSTVLGVLKQFHDSVKNLHIVQTISYPMKEGALMARELADAGIEVRLIADAGAATAVGESDIALIGADSIHRYGVVNKLGSLGIALSARHFGVPVYAVADSSKLVAGDNMPYIERQHSAELTDLQHPRIEVENVYFEITPLELFKGIVMEEGIFTPEHLRTRLKKFI